MLPNHHDDMLPHLELLSTVSLLKCFGMLYEGRQVGSLGVYRVCSVKLAIQVYTVYVV